MKDIINFSLSKMKLFIVNNYKMIYSMRENRLYVFGKIAHEIALINTLAQKAPICHIYKIVNKHPFYV